MEATIESRLSQVPIFGRMGKILHFAPNFRTLNKAPKISLLILSNIKRIATIEWERWTPSGFSLFHLSHTSENEETVFFAAGSDNNRNRPLPDTRADCIQNEQTDRLPFKKWISHDR